MTTEDSPYEYYNKQLGVKMRYLISDRNRHEKSLCVDQYRTFKKRLDNPNTCEKQLRTACFGCDALVQFSTLPRVVKDALVARWGDGHVSVEKNHFKQAYAPDYVARQFYINHVFGDDNKKLDHAYIDLYQANASVLNTVIKMRTNRLEYAKARNLKGSFDLWQSLSNDVNAFREVTHDLPTSRDGLRRKVTDYEKNSYKALISEKFGMRNAVKRNAKVENILITLHCLSDKPYVEKTHERYHDFLRGEIEVVNIKTGEMHARQDFYKNGKPVELSIQTVFNILNAPENAVVIAKIRNGVYDFNHKMRPHVNRYAPKFSMSKISLDDRDIMHTKLHDGTKVMAYYAFDVMSGAMIGIAHSRSKNAELYLDCIRNMFQFTASHGLGTPMQMEVENHLVSDFRDGLMKVGNVFPIVRWCLPTNSQEKGAEHFIGMKKYGVEKNNNQNVGRHYARRDSNRTTIQKIFDEFNDNYKDAKATFEQIVANEMQEQQQYNNQLHSNQKLYAGQTRLEVFLNNVNPELPKLDNAQLYRYIGNHTATSIRRNQYAVVQYEKFQLSSPQIIKRLQSNNYSVDAYYLKSASGKIDEIYLYQNGQYLDTCQPVPRFNTANAEWTDADFVGFENATKYISQFDAMVRHDSINIPKATIIRNDIAVERPAEKTSYADFEELEPEYEYATVNTINERSRAINDL